MTVWLLPKHKQGYFLVMNVRAKGILWNAGIFRGPAWEGRFANLDKF